MGRKNKSQVLNNANLSAGTSTTTEKLSLFDLTNQLLKICSDDPPSGAKLWDEYKELYSIVQTVIGLEKDILFPTTNREEHFEKFMQWLRENSLNLDAVEIAQVSQGEYGLKATTEIKEEKLWLSVPREVHMSTHTTQSFTLVDVLKNDPITKHLPNVGLSLHVLEERLNPASFWAPYLDILPSEYNTILYFSLSEMELLKGSPCLEEALKQYRHIVRQYAYYWQFFRQNRNSRSLHLKNKFTFNSYRWAVSTVMTRQNAIPSPDGTERWISLVPLWDMCNHAQGNFSTDFNLEKGALECYAQRDYKKGDEFVIFYGPRPNSEFFIHNAFIDPDNLFDSVAIKLGISKNDPLAGKKGSILQQLDINFNDPFHVTIQPQPITARLLAFIRVFVMEESDLNNRMDSANTDLFQLDCQLEEGLNKKIWTFFKVRLSLLLKAYPTTLQEDEQLFSENEFHDSRTKLALQLRMSEKRVLKHALDYVNEQCS